MYVLRRAGGELGFWGGLFRGSLNLFKHTIPVVAAIGTGGASAGVVAGAGQVASLAKGKPKQAQVSAQPQNWFEQFSKTEKIVGGIGAAALLVTLVKR